MHIIILLLINLIFSIERIGYIAEVSGYVEVISSRYDKYQEVQAIDGRFLYEQDKIRSYDNGYCVIVFNDQTSLVILSGESELIFPRIEIGLKKIKFNYGNIFVENKDKDVPIFLFTKSSQIKLKKAAFFLNSTLDRNDEIIAFDNSVDIFNKISKISLNLKSSNKAISSSSGTINIVENNSNSVPNDILNSKDIAKSFLTEPLFKLNRKSGDLVPDFYQDFSIDVYKLKNKKKFTTELSVLLSYLNNNLYNQFLVSPKYFSKNFNFDIGINFYSPIESDSPSINQYDDGIKLLAKINKLNYTNSSNSIVFKSGRLKNINIGHGLLIKNYRNAIGYPFKNKFGLTFNYLSDNFFNFQFFTSNIEGGFFAAHSSIFISKYLPLKLGLGFVVDSNTLYDINSKFIVDNRPIKSFEIDASYDLINQKGYKINLISELAAMIFPDDYFYKRYNSSSDLNGALKSKSGSWGAAIGAEGTFSQFINFKTLIHYNDPLFLPSYFNSTYETEKYRFLPIKPTYSNNIAQIDAMYSNLEQLHLSNDERVLVVPKDLYLSYQNTEYVYPSAGLSFDFRYSFYEQIITYLSFSSFFELSNPNSSSNLSCLDFQINITDKVLKNIKELEIYFSKNYTNKIMDLFEYNENTIIGLNVSTKIKYNLLVDLTLERVNYDFNFDTITDNVDLVEFGLKYEF